MNPQQNHSCFPFLCNLTLLVHFVHLLDYKCSVHIDRNEEQGDIGLMLTHTDVWIIINIYYKVIRDYLLNSVNEICSLRFVGNPGPNFVQKIYIDVYKNAERTNSYEATF